jgi:hypothetical protein
MTKWPNRRVVLAVAAVVVVVDLAAAASRVPSLARIGYDNAKEPYRLVRDADLDPFASFAPTEAVAVARQTIPRDATYAIVVGDDPPRVAPTLVRDIFRLWLLPRRYTTRLDEAQWVIAYHHASETIGVPYSKEIGFGPGVNALQVRR